MDADTVAELDGLLDLFHYIQPVNSDEERERFLDAVEAGERYDPSYTYRAFEDGDTARELLDAVEDAAGTALEERLAAGLRGRFEMMTAIGTGRITERSAAHYGEPGEELVAAARAAFTESGGGKQDAAVDGAQLKEAFDALFDEIDVSYSCRTTDVDIIRNSSGERRILVPADKTYSVSAARRLLVHESTHSVRTVNGGATGQLPLQYGTAGYETAEEGLATFNEAEMDVFGETRPRITARVIAVAAADEGFHDLFDRMRELGLDRRTAFIRAYRVKRGLQDTSRPGGFIKDHIYFQGYRRLEQTPELADALYVGKTGFDDAGRVDAEPGISRAEHLAACEQVADRLLA
ncbi:MAG: DUF1704 domain-containing protein [Candidatus Nanohaloarchaea archaeon]|nr:DUF1704 domain-containing protein [Candidatus Nanohaloarchaea archaeon]